LTVQELQENYESQRAARLEKEKEIMQKMADEFYKLLQSLEKEKAERTFKMEEMREEFANEIKAQTTQVQTHQQKTFEDFAKMKNDVEAEMSSRFAHQDEIIDNLSRFITKFQDTLKVVGKNV
jgi:hypothetical protein